MTQAPFSGPRILSINAGKVAPLFIRQGPAIQQVVSGIRKQSLQGSVRILRLGVAGDEQADLTVHGGPDKAVYLYPHEHYAFWNGVRQQALKQTSNLLPGAFGENLTTTGLLESELWVGDRLQLDELVLEVTEPRAPCYKFAALMGYPHAVKQMLQSGYSGVYLKVVCPGAVQAGTQILLVPGPREMRIAHINDRRLRGRQRDLF